MYIPVGAVAATSADTRRRLPSGTLVDLDAVVSAVPTFRFEADRVGGAVSACFRAVTSTKEMLNNVAKWIYQVQKLLLNL